MRTPPATTADVTVCELATVVAEDPGLKVLLLYLEGIPDPWHLAEAAAVARERGLPVVALKSGRTPAGQVAALSHTGALASEDRVVDAFLAEHGIWRVQDMVRAGRRGGAVPAGLEAEGPAAGGDQQFRALSAC
jgi:acyl-CoA synthetase (NDP forming)